MYLIFQAAKEMERVDYGTLENWKEHSHNKTEHIKTGNTKKFPTFSQNKKMKIFKLFCKN